MGRGLQIKTQGQQQSLVCDGGARAGKTGRRQSNKMDVADPREEKEKEEEAAGGWQDEGG